MSADPKQARESVVPPLPAARSTPQGRLSVVDRAGPTARFTGLAIGALVLLVVTWLMLVGTPLGQRIENAALLGAEFRTSLERDRGLERLSVVSATMFGFALVAVFLVALARRRAGLALVVAGSMLVTVVGAELLKAVLPRPEHVDGARWILRNSFPSGTAAAAAAIAIGVLLVAPARLRWLVLPIGAVYAAAIGEATQATGWHRLSDVVGSTLLAVGVAAAGLAVLASAGLVQPAPAGGVDRRIRNTLGVIALIAVLLGGALLALAGVFPLLTSPIGARRVFLQTAFPLLGGGFTVAALTAFSRVVEPFNLGIAAPARRPDAPSDPTRGQ